MARRHGLPRRIWDFIAEHHGTTLVSYFHQRAIQESGNEPVDEADFRYPGPRPQTKETAIVMLADSVEACVRANRPSTQSEMEHIIHRMMSNRLMDGQLDECDLTLKDLDRVRAAFNSVLQGIFHPRIEYPEAVHGPTPQNT
ncbi:Cyclic-di-AMP phosphodiesterase PgpH [subsurface metagenome]